MNKIGLFTVFLLFSVPFWGQTQKKHTQFKASTTIKSELEIVKTNAGNWFKEFYVENSFKDPYSYKLLKITATSKNINEALSDTLEKRIKNINSSKFSSEKNIEASRAKCQASSDEIEKELEELSKSLNAETNQDRISAIQKMIDINKKYKILFLNLLKDIDLYNLEVEEKESLEKQLRELTPEQLNQIAYFEIKIDCYSKNSLGNEVLGRFIFPFTKNGPIGNKNGFDKVVQLNKE